MTAVAPAPPPPPQYALPSDRVVTWNPGLNAVGGIPNRTTIHTTLSPSGSDDTATIQAALDACPADQVVKLTAGVFNISGAGLAIPNSHVTLRGAGPGPGTWAAGTAASGTGGTYLVKATGSNAPVVTIGTHFIDGSPTNFTPVAFATDGLRGSSTVTVADATGLAAGDLIAVNRLTFNTTVAAGSNGVNPTTFTGSGVLNVASTSGADTASQVIVPVSSGGHALISYTGLSGGNQLTGCTFVDGQTGIMSTGGVVLDTSLAHWNATTPENAAAFFEEPNRPIGEVMEIASVSGNTLTFTTPFSIDYTVAHQAEFYKLISLVQYSGVEDVYCYGGEGGDGGGGILVWNAKYCWVKHVEDTWTIGGSIHVDQSFRCEIRDSYFHDPQLGLFSGGSNYGIGLNWYTSHTLIENSISIKFNKVNVMRSAGAGNVWGYNYMDDGGDQGGAYQECMLEGNHMTCPHHVLFEGNQGGNSDTDDTWGNAIYIAYFRNHFIGEMRDFANTGPFRCVGITQWNGWFSYVGNVLGTSGDTNYTIYEQINPSNWNGNAWLLAYEHADAVPDNGRCIDTILRDGNFDYVTGDVHWHGVGGTGAANGLTPPSVSLLPNSLYLAAKPSFFGSGTWPWVDGSNASTPFPGTLPARARYDAGTPNA